MFTHGGTQLRELALGEVGVIRVERLGDDEPRARSRRGTPGARCWGCRRSRRRSERCVRACWSSVLVEARHRGSRGSSSTSSRDGTLGATGRRPPPHAPRVSPGARSAPRRRSDGRCRCRRTGRRCAAASAPSTAGTRSAWSRSSSSSRGANGCWSATSSASGRPRQFLFLLRTGCWIIAAGPAAGEPATPPIGGRCSSCSWSGSSASGAPHSEHSPGQSGRQTGWNGSCGHHRVPEHGLQVEQVALEHVLVVVVVPHLAGGGPRGRRSRTVPGSPPCTGRLDRFQAPHAGARSTDSRPSR